VPTSTPQNVIDPYIRKWVHSYLSGREVINGAQSLQFYQKFLGVPLGSIHGCWLILIYIKEVTHVWFQMGKLDVYTDIPECKKLHPEGILCYFQLEYTM